MTNLDERQPLISHDSSVSAYQTLEDGTGTPNQAGTPTHNVDTESPEIIQGDSADSRNLDESADGDSAVKKATQRTFWDLAWTAIVVLLCIAGAASLIKGFIDAGDNDFDFKKALYSALGGGLSGAAAMILQVLTLMPLRTVMNYQYRYGTSTTTALHTLYTSGGIPRLYSGLLPALFQGPIARFGDTAANVGILALMRSNGYMKTLPPWIQTIFVSTAAALFRMVLTPVDTLKTTMQTQGRDGWKILKARIKADGVTTLWYGAVATAAATFVGNYPWFTTYNTLQCALPPAYTILQKLFRQAFIGFVASVISDTVSNSLRVVKTYRQVNRTTISYTAAARAVIASDGLQGLFGRGLKTRILANGLQGLMFSVLWKLFLDLWEGKTNAGLMMMLGDRDEC